MPKKLMYYLLENNYYIKVLNNSIDNSCLCVINNEIKFNCTTDESFDSVVNCIIKYYNRNFSHDLMLKIYEYYISTIPEQEKERLINLLIIES